MNNLTPEEAGSSAVALAIAKRILRQPAMKEIRLSMSVLCPLHIGDVPTGLKVFCGHLAREIDFELQYHGLSFRHANRIDPMITLTPSEQGKLDGILAKGDTDAIRTSSSH